MPFPESRVPPTHNDESGLIDLLSALKGGWRTILLFAVAGLAAGAVWLIGYAWYDPQITTYKTALRFEAKGGEAEHYPNGLKFSLTDLTSPAVLDAAYAAVATSIPKLSRDDLAGAVSTASYSPERELIRNQYMGRLSEKGLSVAERNQMEQDFAKALEEAGPDGVQINLSIKTGSATPSGAAAVVQAILDNWTRIFITEYGVASRPGSTESKLLIGEEITEDQDYPIVFLHLERAASELASRVEEMSRLPGGEGVAVGGRTIQDIGRDAQQILLRSINEKLAPAVFSGLSRFPESSAAKLEFAAQSIRDSLAGLQAKTRLIDELLAQSEPSSAAGKRTQVGGSETTVTQLSDETSDRLIELAIENAAQPFKQDLLRQKQAFGEQIADLTIRLARTERLSGALDTTGSIRASRDAVQFIAVAKAAALDMNRLWSEMNSLSESASAANLNPSRTFYSRIPIRQGVTVSGGITDPRAWGGAILFLLASIAAGVGARLLRRNDPAGFAETSGA